MSLPVKKIYVDSRYMTNDSISTSNFKFQLDRSLFMPQNTVFYLEDVCIPHSWHTVEKDFNDTIYMWFSVSSGSDPFIVWNNTMYVIKLTPNNYTGSTLATEIKTKLQTIDATFTTTFTVVYDLNNHNIVVGVNNPNVIFVFPTDGDLIKNYGVNTSYEFTLTGVPFIDTTNLNSWNDLIGNVSTLQQSMNAASASIRPFVSGMLDLLTVRNIYISSPNLGSFSSIGARGESNIIKKVPGTSDFGFLIVDTFTSPYDFSDCSKLTLNTLEFVLRDVKGTIIPLHGGHVSFSIVFSVHNVDT